MALIRGNCPRCDTIGVTFEVLDLVETAHDAATNSDNEAFLICRNCRKTTSAQISIKDKSISSYRREVKSYEQFFDDMISIASFVSLQKNVSRSTPDGLPDHIRGRFGEALICMEYDCYNAAASTFRTCIDLATRSLLPVEQTDGLPEKTRRDLRLRLNWLINNGQISRRLEALAECIREDGNEAVHLATLDKNDVIEIYDFAYFFLEEMYAIQFRLDNARARRSARNSEKQK